MAGCTPPGCKAIGYDFSNLSNTPQVISTLPYISDTKMTSAADNAVIIKDEVNAPPSISGVPGYDFFSTPFEHRQLTSGDWIHVTYPGVPDTGNTLDKCVDVCNKGTDCAGFNFSSMNGMCEFFPTGSSTTPIQSRGTSSAYADDEWVKRFDSSEKGSAYRKKKPIPVGGNDTVPSAVDLTTTGRFCRDLTKCNQVISNVLAAGEMTEFDASYFTECSGCPSRQYKTSGSNFTVTNEMGLSRTFGTKDAAKAALLYSGGQAAAHTTDFSAGKIVTIKKLDGTVLFSNFNSNVSGNGTTSANWVNSKNEPRKIFYEPVDYVTNGYLIEDQKEFSYYSAATGKFEKDFAPKYTAGYTANVYIIT
jgi:hypothetical protein